ncbi:MULTISPECIES: epoxide hydrolase family protein [Amycolatopsis]|uniref:epoxide hydrolase family protein n=1 Tax=Amycolatopsis sp. CB00013 TaxID=1703945 RepID=UPI000939A794|nr:epoxide hydrolase family protein [Amycolatopsis sp. CB00013]OKK01413.1 epoxide hydrolase [Amycolatopsis sp. CB00013]
MRPFQLDVPESQLEDLRQRIAATRWSPDVPGIGWERGVPREYLEKLADYWRTGYDWRAVEARLNAIPQYVTEIDGANVHFVHVRSPEPNAKPLIVTHGWPGSFVEFLDVIGPLTDPVAHGGGPDEAFHLVIPAIPGFGFSGPLPEAGWTVARIAKAWAELMRRLGYERYGAQGGDFGSVISLELGRVDPEHVIGVHSNMLAVFPSGDPAELADLSEQDQARLGRLARFDTEDSGYLKLLSTRPQTPAYALNDSPVGQLAWIVERFKEWTTPDGVPEDVLDRDALLTNVMIYWLTGTAGSSGHLYYEVLDQQKQQMSAQSAGMLEGHRELPLTVPVGVAVFPNDCFLPIRRLADRDIETIVHWHEFDRGGHFPAMEVPDLYVDEVRTFFHSL